MHMLTRQSENPPRGSVVMTQSLTGTAFQRFFSDGLWHSTTGQIREFTELFDRPHGLPEFVALVFVPPQEGKSRRKIDMDKGDRVKVVAARLKTSKAVDELEPFVGLAGKVIDRQVDTLWVAMPGVVVKGDISRFDFA